ncbi:MAG: acyl-CoA dehydrogenase family protein [Alphaproteobacteria bacterium]
MVARAAALVPLLRDRAAETERQRRLLPDVRAALHESGLFRIMQPRWAGGLELPHPVLVDVASTLARGCPSTAWIYANMTIHAAMVGYFEPAAQREIWGPSVDTLVCMSVIWRDGRARRVAGGYRLSGHWPFCSGISNSEWHMVAAMVEPDATMERPEARLFLLPQGDYTVLDNWHVMGLAGSDSRDVTVDDVFVPEYRTLADAATQGREAPGNVLNPAPVYRIPMQAAAPPTMASIGLGTAQGMLELFVDEIRTRTARYTGRGMAGLQTIQIAVAEAGARLDTARLVLRGSGEEALAIAASGGVPDLETRLRWRRNAGFGTALAREAVDILHRRTGGGGLYEAKPLARLWRDFHAVTAHVAFNLDAAAGLYGRHMLGLDVNLTP